MFYTEITETTCKTVCFSGIHGIYVNNDVQKHIFAASGPGDRGFAFSAQSASSLLVSGKRENIHLR